MGWRVCIVDPKKGVLNRCQGSLDQNDGYGHLGDSRGDGMGYGFGKGHGMGYGSGCGDSFGCGYGGGLGDGWSQDDWEEVR
jgi:hypothetical protein